MYVYIYQSNPRANRSGCPLALEPRGLQTCTWNLPPLGARSSPRRQGNLVREPARNRKPRGKEPCGRSRASAPRPRPSGRLGWARAGGRSRGAANSPSAPPPGALPSKPLLPAPLQTAGPRRPSVTEAAAGRVRRPVAGATRVGRGFRRVPVRLPATASTGDATASPRSLPGATLRGCADCRRREP